MKYFKEKLSTRRKILLGLLFIIVLALYWMQYAGMAIMSGISTKEMDWDADKIVTQTEIAQSFYAVKFTTTQEGNRRCLAFFWRSSGESIRVDCKTEFKTEK